MKRCPECRRDYYDDTLFYCLDDGNALLEGPRSPDTPVRPLSDEPATAILSERPAVAGGLTPQSDPLSESPTRNQIHSTDQTAIFPRGAEAEPQNPLSDSSERPSLSAHRAAKPQGKFGGRNKLLMMLGIAIVLVVGGIGFAVYKFWLKADKPPQAMSIERLTTNGKSRDAAISPDGKYVVYIVDEGGLRSLWTRQVATTSNVQIVPPADVQYSGLVFSPDSNYINFVKRETAGVPLALYQMPVLGGIQKRLISNISSGVAYAPDGRQFAFVRQSFPETDESSLLIASSDGTGERILATLKRPEFFATIGGQIPAWSPDGKTIASTAFSLALEGLKVVEVQVADGSLKDITAQEWHSIRRIAWMTDKSGLLILGANKPAGRYNQQIWSISYPDGEVRRITTDSNDYHGMSVSVDSGSIAAVPLNVHSNIWVAAVGDIGSAVQIKSGGNNLDGIAALAWTSDGRIVYHSLASGIQDVWIMTGDGGGQKQLTAEAGRNFEAFATPDGRYIVFTSGRDDGNNIWRMDMDGGNARQLTKGGTDDDAAVSPDSQWVIYDSRKSGDWNVWKISVDGGDALQLTDYSSREPQVSPDGKLIACEYREDVNSPWRYAIIPFEGGKPVRVFDLAGKEHFRWSKDSRSITYNDTLGGVGNIWSFPLDGAPPKQLTNFKTEQIYNFDWSADGKNLVLARGTTTSDVVLIKDFR